MATLREQLIADEGKRTSAYKDSLGYWTIGVGRLIDASMGGFLRDDEINLMLDNDIASARRDCKKLFPAYDTFSQDRQDALANMMFNLGIKKFTNFTTTVGHINAGKWAEAQESAAQSLWFRQVGKRAERIIKQMGVA
jgi:lysozyme